MSFKGNVVFKKTVDTDKASKEGMIKGIIETALKIKAQAQALSPVQYGELKDSIDIGTINNKLEIRVGTNVEHGIYQEYGTKNMAAHPFMRPSVELVKGASVEATKKALNEAIK